MRTTLKRGVGRGAVVNGDGHAVLPPGVLSPVTHYRQPERRRSIWRSAGRIVFLVLALLFAVAAGLAGGSYLTTLESVNDTAPKERVRMAAKALDIPLPNRPTVALVIGYDHRPEDGAAPSRSDTVMLLRADPNTDSISMLSFPRDLIVDVRCPNGGSSLGRINSAYAFCGPAGTLETVRGMTGLQVHYLIAVNFDGFRQVVDKLGGVWLDVDRRYFNDNRSGGYSYATIDLRPGYQRLKGWQALDFVRYRHTDSDLYRVARQQDFVQSVKQVVNKRWKDPTRVLGIVGALRKNVEIGQAGGKGISLKTLTSYALLAYGAQDFFQVKVEGLTGAAELRTDPVNIQSAVDEFQHPDVDASTKAAARALRRRANLKSGPNPKNVSVVVLNGNGVAGSAANTSYQLGQRGYDVRQPPEGYLANAPARAFRTQVYFSPRKEARNAAVYVSRLFNSADVKPLPLRNSKLVTLANGSLVTVVLGQTFGGHLTATAIDRTPPREPPNVRSAASETGPAARQVARWKLDFPVQVPTVLEATSRLDTEVPARVYEMNRQRAVRFTFRTGSNEYWGVQESEWADAPALEDKDRTEVIGGRTYDLYFDGPHLHMVVLRAGGARYWVVNTLLDSLSNETMIAIAQGLKPLRGLPK